MNSTKNLLFTILKSLGLAMGVAVFILNLLGSIEAKDSIKLLSLGMIANGLYSFQKKN